MNYEIHKWYMVMKYTRRYIVMKYTRRYIVMKYTRRYILDGAQIVVWIMSYEKDRDTKSDGF